MPPAAPSNYSMISVPEAVPTPLMVTPNFNLSFVTAVIVNVAIDRAGEGGGAHDESIPGSGMVLSDLAASSVVQNSGEQMSHRFAGNVEMSFSKFERRQRFPQNLVGEAWIVDDPR
jgi:hypothetical protein